MVEKYVRTKSHFPWNYFNNKFEVDMDFIKTKHWTLKNYLNTQFEMDELCKRYTYKIVEDERSWKTYIEFSEKTDRVERIKKQTVKDLFEN